MNETNENNVNQTPVEQVTPTPVTPVPEVAAPVEPVQQTEVAQVSQTEPVVNNQESNSSEANTPVSESQDSSGAVSENEIGDKNNNPNEAKLRFPLVVVVIFVIFIIFIFIYYFVLITPKNLFNKALKAQVGGVIDLITLEGDNQYSTRNYKVKTVVDTVGDKVSQKENVVFLDGLEYNFELGRDIKNGNISLNILSNVSDFENVDKMQHEKNIDSTYYYYNQSIYAKASDAVLKTNTHGDNTGNSGEVFDLLKEAIYEMVDQIDVNKVERSITTKSVKNQSLLAIRFNTEFTNEEINKILQATISNLLDNSKHPEFISKFAKNLDITEEQAKETIEGFKNYKIKAKNIKLDYYLNLACTGIVSYELNVDNTIISMSSLNGYYFVDIDNNNFDIDFNINTKTEDFDFKVLIDNDKTYTYVLGESKKILNDKFIPIGNDFVLEVYEETEKNSSKKKDKPYLIIDSHIDYEYNTDIKFFNEKDAIPYEEGSAEDLDEIKYTIEKLGYEFTYLLGLNLVNRTDVTAPEFAKKIFNIEVSPELPPVETVLPETDTIVGNVEVEEPEIDENLNLETPEENNNENLVEVPEVEENVSDISTKSE